MESKRNSYLKMKDYFAYLVFQSTFLNSFVGYFRRELLNKDSNDELTEPYLAIFDYRLGLSGPPQNTISVRKLRFAIMFNNIPSDDFDLQYKAIDDAEEMILQVIARIKHDSEQQEHFLYNSLIKESIDISEVELDLRSFGSECYIEFKNNKSLSFDRTKWKDIKQTCN